MPIKSFPSPFAFPILFFLPSSLWYSLYCFCSTLHLLSPLVRCLILPHVTKPSTSQTNLQFEKAHILLQIVCLLFFLSMTINLFSLLRSSNNQNVSRFQLLHWFESRSRSDICALRIRFGCEVIPCGLFVGGSKNLYLTFFFFSRIHLFFFLSFPISISVCPLWISLLWKSQFDSIRTLLFYVLCGFFSVFRGIRIQLTFSCAFRTYSANSKIVRKHHQYWKTNQHEYDLYNIFFLLAFLSLI